MIFMRKSIRILNNSVRLQSNQNIEVNMEEIIKAMNIQFEANRASNKALFEELNNKIDNVSKKMDDVDARLLRIENKNSEVDCRVQILEESSKITSSKLDSIVSNSETEDRLQNIIFYNLESIPGFKLGKSLYYGKKYTFENPLRLSSKYKILVEKFRLLLPF